MDIVRAKELLTILADGVNPLTGEVLSDEDSCNQVEIVRALNTVLKELDRKDRRKELLPENAGKPWSAEDDDALARMFDSGAARKDICDYFKRTSGAITSRLVRLGKIK